MSAFAAARLDGSRVEHVPRTPRREIGRPPRNDPLRLRQESSPSSGAQVPVSLPRSPLSSGCLTLSSLRSRGRRRRDGRPECRHPAGDPLFSVRLTVPGVVPVALRGSGESSPGPRLSRVGVPPGGTARRFRANGAAPAPWSRATYSAGSGGRVQPRPEDPAAPPTYAGPTDGASRGTAVAPRRIESLGSEPQRRRSEASTQAAAGRRSPLGRRGGSSPADRLARARGRNPAPSPRSTP